MQRWNNANPSWVVLYLRWRILQLDVADSTFQIDITASDPDLEDDIESLELANVILIEPINNDFKLKD